MNVLSNVLAQRPFESSGSGTAAGSSSTSAPSTQASAPSTQSGTTPLPQSARKEAVAEDKKVKPKKSTLMLNLVGKKAKDKSGKDDAVTPRGGSSGGPGSPTSGGEEEKAPEQIALALKTLGSFNLTRYISSTLRVTGRSFSISNGWLVLLFSWCRH